MVFSRALLEVGGRGAQPTLEKNIENNRVNKQAFINYHTAKQKQFFKAFARDYLSYLGNPNPTNKQLAEVQTLLSQSWVQRPLCIDECLTTREQQCLYLSSLGKSIATFLELSQRQVERHRNTIFLKLTCKNIAEAVAKGLRYRELRPPD
ncbi:response regulator transcription factor [Legionella tunisiensis]|uniref:response regulator transcription factor n=1 Tax=Legionella tunisiensis TaxID=1034944 RepID=UPI000318265F|nr:helix-turn-helix transcriptional regulator [Legionella tunisiensis]